MHGRIFFVMFVDVCMLEDTPDKREAEMICIISQHTSVSVLSLCHFSSVQSIYVFGYFQKPVLVSNKIYYCICFVY
jgi:hypothetical protein